MSLNKNSEYSKRNFGDGSKNGKQKCVVLAKGTLTDDCVNN